MTQQHESRWTLASRGNRILFAVVVGLVVSFVVRGLDLAHGGADLLVSVIAAGVAYGIFTALARQAGSDSSR